VVFFSLLVFQVLGIIAFALIRKNPDARLTRDILLFAMYFTGVPFWGTLLVMGLQKIPSPRWRQKSHMPPGTPTNDTKEI